MPERQRQSSGHIDQRSCFLTKGVDHRSQSCKLGCRGRWLEYLADLLAHIAELRLHTFQRFHGGQIAPRLAGVAARRIRLNLQGTRVFLGAVSFALRRAGLALQGLRPLLGLIGVALRLLLLNLRPQGTTCALRTGQGSDRHVRHLLLRVAPSGDDVDQGTGLLALGIDHRAWRLFMPGGLGTFQQLAGREDLRAGAEEAMRW